jgi:hypothetical protein
VDLARVAAETDSGFPSNQFLRIENGEPVLGRLPRRAEPKLVKVLERRIAERIEPLDILDEMWSRNQPDGTPVLNLLRLPGTSGDYVELSNKPKPISPVAAGTAAHISLEVPEIRAAQKEVLARVPDAALKEPRFGLDQRWQFNLFDPDGTRVELMQPRATAPK